MINIMIALLALHLVPLTPPAAETRTTSRTLSFEERVQAQRAVEEVLHAHRIWPEANPRPKPALSSVLPDEILRSRVEDTLRKSEALHQLWGKEISAEQLQAELDRMAKESRDPALLRELFAALGDDPLLIAETLARTALADRLIRSSYEDELDTPKKPFDTFWAERRMTFSAIAPFFPADAFSLPAVTLDSCLQDDWSPMATAPIPGRSRHTAVWTGAEMIVWGGDLYNTGARYTPATDTWTPTSTGSGVPAGRLAHTAVWTGTEMIVWGGGTAGSQPSGYYNTGGRYSPATDTWTPTPTGSGVPTGRVSHAAVWTGTEMIVWGGVTRTPAVVYLNTGGRYDPASNQWLATSVGPGVPAPRSGPTAVWTGTEMIVWGGSAAALFGDGGRYAPSSDSWIAVPADASSPLRAARTRRSGPGAG